MHIQYAERLCQRGQLNLSDVQPRPAVRASLRATDGVVWIWFRASSAAMIRELWPAQSIGEGPNDP